MIQRRATRWILSSYSPYQSVTEQKQLNLRTLEQRRVNAKVITMFKIIHGLVAIPVPPYFEQPIRSTRHSHPLALHQIHTTAIYYKFAFFPSTVVYWNQLPAQIVLLSTLDHSVCQCGRIIINNFIYFYLFLHIKNVRDGVWQNMKIDRIKLLIIIQYISSCTCTFNNYHLHFFFFLKLSTVTVRHNQPAHNPREGCCRI